MESVVFRKGLARFLNVSGCLPGSEFPVSSSPHVSQLRIKALRGITGAHFLLSLSLCTAGSPDKL